MRQGSSKLERSLRENCDLFVKRGSMMSWRWALLLLALLLPSQGLVLAQLSKQAPDFDVRGPRESTLPAPAAAVLPEQSQALTDLSDEAEGDLTISWSALTGAPSRVGRRGGTLTLPMNAPPHAIANVFLSRFRSLLNLSPQDVAEIEFSRDFTTQHNGVSHLTLQQQASGVDVYGGGIKVSIDAEGRIINVSGEPIPNLHSSVNINTPVISSDEAVLAAAAAAGVNNVSESSSLGLIYFPLAPGNVRLAWKVTFQDADSPNLYESIVDAVDGTVLWRQSLTDYNHIPAQGQVFTSDSPEPNTPKDSPITGVSRQTVSFTGEDFFPHDDPHYDWWDGADRIITTSNNVDAYLDVNGNDVADTDSRAEAADEDFSFALDLAMDPTTYQDAAVTNLFYWNNRLHDFFYRLGFDEASGNFQDDNLGLGGILAFGGDAVNAEAQDNSQPPSMDPDDRSLCNANMSTPGDGSSPKMQMFLCVSKRCSENEFKGCRTNADCSGTCDPWTDNFPTPERDGDFDNVVIGHEYTHGVHKRLVPTMGNQRANEGWSDYFGLSLVAEPDDPYDGAYGVGDYLFNLLGDGIRSYPYSTDLSVYKRTYADINDRASCAEKVCSGELDKICSEDSDCDAGQECDSVKCEFHTDCQEPVTEADLGLCTPSVSIGRVKSGPMRSGSPG